MSLLWLPVGLLLPAISGWLLLSMIEGQTPVLQRIERWVMGGYLGLTIAMLLSFVLHVTIGVSFSLLGFLLTQLGWTALLFVWMRGHFSSKDPPPPAHSPKIPQWLQ